MYQFAHIQAYQREMCNLHIERGATKKTIEHYARRLRRQHEYCAHVLAYYRYRFAMEH